MAALCLNFPSATRPGNILPRWVSYLLGALSALFSAQSSGTPLREVEREADRQLVQEALSGDPGFEKLVKAYEKMVYRVAYRFLGSEADACDVAQEVFVRVYKSLPKFRGDSALSTWIYTITANLSKNAIRSKRNREKTQVLAPREEDGDRPFWDRVADRGAVAPSRGTESGDLGGAIQAALSNLPPDYREAVILRDLEDLDYQEIAGILKAELGTVKSRIARGRALLREKLKDWL